MTHTLPNDTPDDPMIDWVPGVPPVGLTVWRTPTGDHGGDGPISARLAYRLAAAYTNPGDLIIDLTGALATVAATGGRIHMPATFTGAHLHTTPTRRPAPPPARTPRRAARGGEPPDLRDWFGDDLHDPAQATTSPEIWRLASLIVAHWPLDPDPATATARLAALTQAAARALEPGGCAVFAADRGAGGDYTSLVTTARAAGLRYFQHIVAVTADIDGDQLIYNATSHHLADTTGTHIGVHIDLIIFTRSGGHPDD